MVKETKEQKSALTTQKGGCTFLNKDGTPDVAAQKKHDDAMSAQGREDKAPNKAK